VQKKACLHVQKQKGGNATVCEDKLACCKLKQHVKELVVHGEKEFA